jgi:hypothetical protein
VGRWMRWGWCLVAALVLTGCFQIDLETSINPDGSGSVAIAYGVNTYAMERLSSPSGVNQIYAVLETVRQPSQFDEFYLLDGVEVSSDEFRQGTVYWYVRRFAVPDIRRLGSIFGDEVTFSLERQPGALADTFRYHWQSPPLATDLLGASPQQMAEYQEAINTYPALDPLGLKVRWIVHMPGDVVSHNADKYDPITGRLTWEIDLGASEDWDFRAESRAVKRQGLWIAAAVFGLVILLGAGLAGLALSKLLAWRRDSLQRIKGSGL